MKFNCNKKPANRRVFLLWEAAFKALF